MAVILYFSYKGENLIHGKITSDKIGRTAIVANKISEQLDGISCLELKPQYPYPETYQQIVGIAEIEKKEKKYVSYQNLKVDFDNDEEVFLGYPNWCGTIPRIVASFFEDYPFDHKKVYPFCTHEGGGFGNSINELKAICPKTQFFPGMPILGTKADKSDITIKNWLRQYHLNREK